MHVFSLICHLWSLTHSPLTYTGFITSAQYNSRIAMDGCCQFELFEEKVWLCNEFSASSSQGHTQV